MQIFRRHFIILLDRLVFYCNKSNVCSGPILIQTNCFITSFNFSCHFIQLVYVFDCIDINANDEHLDGIDRAVKTGKLTTYFRANIELSIYSSRQVFAEVSICCLRPNDEQRSQTQRGGAQTKIPNPPMFFAMYTIQCNKIKYNTTNNSRRHENID